MTNGRTWTCVGLALIAACALAAPAAAEDQKMDLQQLSKTALREGVKASQVLRSLGVDIPKENRPIDPKQWGGNFAFMTIPAQRFQEWTSAFNLEPGDSAFYHKAAGDNGLWLTAPLELQPGTEVAVVCTFWHDTDVGAGGAAFLIGQEMGDSTGAPTIQVLSTTGAATGEAEGYLSNCQILDPAFTVRAIGDLSDAGTVARPASYFFWVFVDFSSQLDLSFGGAIVFFRRLITPAPATDTFDDVPVGDAAGQHRYVEALAAAGITSGCSTSPPLYCPNAPLTRGQMAVFLARIVGLYWPF